MRVVNDETAPRDEQECAPASEGQATDAPRPDAKPEPDERTLEEAGYGYGV